MKTRINILLPTLTFSLISILSCEKKESTHAQAIIDSLQNELNTHTSSEKQLEANKKLVADFYQQLFGDKNIDAIGAYIGETYIQHNPILPDGRDVLKQAVKGWFKDAPKEKIDIRHLSADGDLVYIHTKSTIGGKVSSVIDIFRLKDNKIVEHWDVIQALPDKSANPHPMF